MRGSIGHFRRRAPDRATRLADEFMAAVSERDDVQIPIATNDTALLRELMTRFDRAYGQTSLRFRAFSDCTLRCVDCRAERPAITSRMGQPCPNCGGQRAILRYQLIDPETIDADDVAALGRLWQAQAAQWWQKPGRPLARCDLCNAELARPSGWLHATNLLCERCVDELKAQALADLRQVPYLFGTWELRQAQAFRMLPRAGHLRLDADSLFSKFGFYDGDVPESFDEWRAAQGLEPIDWLLGGDWHWILVELVRTRLLPALNRTVEVGNIGGNHNPIRAVTVDGVEAEEFEQQVRDDLVEDLRPEYVEVPYREVEQLLQRSENGLFPLAPAVADTVRQLGLTPRQRVELRAIATTMSVGADEISAYGQILAGRRAVDPDEVRRSGAPEHEVDRALVARRAAELVARPDLVPRTFDLAHWVAIHRQLFQDTDEAAARVRPEVDVTQQLAALRELTADTASRTLAAVVPALVEARPFTRSLPWRVHNARSRRVLIQHALDRIGLTIDWKWLGADESYRTAADLEECFDLAIS
jgi:fido (protein-threonine AMPylation protein)